MMIRGISVFAAVLALNLAMGVSPVHACGPENDSSITRTKTPEAQAAQKKPQGTAQSGTAESAASSQPKKPSK